MNVEQLKREYPETYAAVLAGGREAAVQQERERANAHLGMGLKAVGVSHLPGMLIMMRAIHDGSSVATTMEEYIMVGANRRDREAAQADSDAADAFLAFGTRDPGDCDLGDQVADLLETSKGHVDRSRGPSTPSPEYSRNAPAPIDSTDLGDQVADILEAGQAGHTGVTR